MLVRMSLLGFRLNTEASTGRQATGPLLSANWNAKIWLKDRKDSMHCLGCFERTSIRQRSINTISVPNSKSRPVWRKRSQIQYCSVVGIVRSDRALKINRYRPAHIGSHAVHARSLRSRRLILDWGANYPRHLSLRWFDCQLRIRRADRRLPSLLEGQQAPSECLYQASSLESRSVMIWK